MNYRDLRRLHDIRDVLGLHDQRKWFVCPLPQHAHENNTPSFSIYFGSDGTQRWKCHGNCGLQGDVIDLVGYVQIPGYDPTNPEHVRMACSRLSEKIKISPPMPKREPKGVGHIWQHLGTPDEEAYAYLINRGITRATVGEFQIRQYRNYIAIPAFQSGMVRAIKYRAFRRSDLRFWSAEGSKNSLFNIDHVQYTEQPVLILKGEIPAMLAHQQGYWACAPTGGESSHADEWLPVLAFAKKRVVVGDNDKNPEVRAEMSAFAVRRGEELHAEVRFPPENYKDWDEWWLADREECERQAHIWLEV